MAFMEKLRTLVGVEEDYEFEAGYEEEDYTAERDAEASGFGLGSSKVERGWEPSVRKTAYAEHPPRSRERDNVVPMQKNQDTLKILTQRFKIVVIEPRTFDECPKLVDSLKTRKPIIINLERVETEVARKIFDFLSGATYALAGNVQKISNNIFVFLPENVDVSTNTEHQGITTFGAEDGNPWKL